MKILLTNDDGIGSEGLRTLASALKNAGCDVVVVAPSENNSAVSHKLTMFSEIPVSRADFGGIRAYAVNGTPTDCVLIGICNLAVTPDLVIAGVNAGVNVGSDVLYSGTVAAAEEGAQNGIPSLAVSQYLRPPTSRHWVYGEDADALARAARITAEHLGEWARLASEAGLVNINLPLGEPIGYRFCKLARTTYRTAYSESERGLRMLFNPPLSAGEGDISLLKAGYATITPLLLDRTDYATLEKWGTGR